MYEYIITDETRKETIDVISVNRLDGLFNDFAQRIKTNRDVNNDQPKIFRFCGFEYDSDDTLLNLFIRLSKNLYGDSDIITVYAITEISF